LESVDSYLAVTQPELSADIVNSSVTAVTGGGLLFALVDAAVDNSRTNTANELLKPILTNLKDYDFPKILQQEINSVLSKIEWLHSSDVVLERTTEDGRFLDHVKKTKASAILFMTAEYKLSPSFNAIETKVSLIMFPNQEALNNFQEKLDKNGTPVDKTDNIYRNDIQISTPISLSDDLKENSSQLAEGESLILKEAMNVNAKKVAEEIYNDLMRDEKFDKNS
jgi:hypothetical protein